MRACPYSDDCDTCKEDCSDLITSNIAEARGGVYAVIGGVTYYYVSAQHPVDY